MRWTRAKAEGLKVGFKCVDLNFVEKLSHEFFDVILCDASISCANLEHLSPNLIEPGDNTASSCPRHHRQDAGLVSGRRTSSSPREGHEDAPPAQAERKKFWMTFLPGSTLHDLPLTKRPRWQVGREGIRQGEIEG